MNLIKRKDDEWFPSFAFVDQLLKPEWYNEMKNLKSHVPSVNIKESEKDFQIELAAPGLAKEDFTIEVNENVLTISCEKEKKDEVVKEGGKYTRREFNYTQFKRAFTLPETIDESKINAVYNKGVLHLVLPKKEEALPKTKRLIDIS